MNISGSLRVLLLGSTPPAPRQSSAKTPQSHCIFEESHNSALPGSLPLLFLKELLLSKVLGKPQQDLCFKQFILEFYSAQPN